MLYKFLDMVINLCEKLQHKLRERNLPKECREPWIKGYKKHRKKSSFEDIDEKLYK